jgi:methylmalonyl-CoA/ethylmalonyl-CoA epimerase
MAAAATKRRPQAKAAVKAAAPAKKTVAAGHKAAKSTKPSRARAPAPTMAKERKAPPARASVPTVAKTMSPATTKRRPSRPLLQIDKLHQVALVASDLDKSVLFYSDVLGLPFITRFDPPGLAFFDLGGGVRLLLSATASTATLYFHVKDINAAVRALSKRGVAFLQKPSRIHRDDAGHFGKKGQEEWMAFFRDPSANLLALVSRK